MTMWVGGGSALLREPGGPTGDTLSDLVADLVSHGMPHRKRVLQSGAFSGVELVVTALSSSAAMTAFAEIVRRFLERHNSSEILVERTETGAKVVLKGGASMDDVERAILLVRELRADDDREARDSTIEIEGFD